MKAGFRERFGEDVISRVLRLGQLTQEAKTDGGEVIEFMLTKRVSWKCVHAHIQ
jgi:hypothetical protein